MKIDRLLGIITYLLNRDIVNASTLAERFEVSTRTIQRDIETINLAGIPIISIQGVNGGYGIVEGFKLEKQILDTEDYLFILTAIRGMCSAYENKKLETTLEKFTSISKVVTTDSRVKLDFSVSIENKDINDYIKVIEKSINEGHIIEFQYTNSCGQKTLRLVEPIGVIYKWYAWYLLAYCCTRKDYRLFKIARIRNLRIVNEKFSAKHESIDKILGHQEKCDARKYIDVKILCKSEIRISIEEYFSNGNITELKNGDFILEFTVPENEVVWKGILLTYGNKVKILEPEQLKESFALKANEIIDIYK